MNSRQLKFMFKSLLMLFFFPILLLSKEHFDCIQSVLDLYKRPITVLSIGENEVIHQIANQYSGTCIITGNKKIERLGSDQIIHLNKHLSLTDLKDLNKREHFDVILVLDSLKKFDYWKEILHELFQLGDHLVIEIQNSNDLSPTERGIAHYLMNLGLTTSLNQSNERPLLWYCFKPKSVQPELYLDQEKNGITFLTYQKHSGNYPSKSWIREERKKLPFWKRIRKGSILMDGKSLY